MNQSIKWFGAILVSILVLKSIGGFLSSPEHDKSIVEKPNDKYWSGYVLQTKEANVLEYILKNDMDAFMRGGEAIFGRNLLKVPILDVVNQYSENQVAADQKYFGKSLFLYGRIDSINSGLGNEPYITFRGKNQFMSPQARFDTPDLNKISALKKGNILVLVCDGAGSIAGIPMFGKCQFSDDYANQIKPLIKSDIENFLNGGKPDATMLVTPLVLTAIVLARNLPENSVCFESEHNFTDRKTCFEQIDTLMKEPTFKNNFVKVVEELKLPKLLNKQN
jgi:hypothetical protein